MSAIDALARMLPSLLVIVGALLLLRHWAARQRGGDAGRLRVVSRTGVTKGAVVAVVALGERRLLVGANEHGVTLLTELDPEEEPAVEPQEVPGVEPDVAPPAGRAVTAAAALLETSPTFSPTDGPRMAPIDRLRHLTVRRAVPSHPRRSPRVPHRT